MPGPTVPWKLARKGSGTGAQSRAGVEACASVAQYASLRFAWLVSNVMDNSTCRSIMIITGRLAPFKLFLTTEVVPAPIHPHAVYTHFNPTQHTDIRHGKSRITAFRATARIRPQDEG